MQRLVLWICVGLLGGALGCKKSNPDQAKLKLYEEIALSSSGQILLKKLHLDAKVMMTSLRKALRKSQDIAWFANAQKPPAHGYTLEVELGMNPLPPDRQRRRVRLRWFVNYRLVPATSGDDVLIVREARDYSYARKDQLPKRDAVTQLFRELWSQGARSLLTFGKLKQMTTPALRKHLASGDLLARRHAARLLGKRKDKKAIPALLKQLSTKDPDLLLSTIGALVKLRAREAAIPLIQLARQREGPFLAQILSALSVIGGEAAKGYLFTIASSHSNRAIQQTAKEGLQDLQQQEKKSTAPTARRP